MYILTRTYNYDKGKKTKLAKKYKSRKKVSNMLHKYLNKDIDKFKKRKGYNPSVLEWSKDDFILVLEKGYDEGNLGDKSYADEDCIYYRIYKLH